MSSSRGIDRDFRSRDNVWVGRSVGRSLPSSDVCLHVSRLDSLNSDLEAVSSSELRKKPFCDPPWPRQPFSARLRCFLLSGVIEKRPRLWTETSEGVVTVREREITMETTRRTMKREKKKRITIAFDDDGSRVISRELKIEGKERTSSTTRSRCDDVVTFYAIERTASVIKRNEYRRVALQFPDDMLCDSPEVVGELTRRVGEDVFVFVLGDTSYGSRCVDEVAASRAGADFLVHYGDAYVGPTQWLPIQYVFGDASVDVDVFANKIVDGATDDERDGVVLFSEPMYVHAMNAIRKRLEARGVRVVLAKPPLNDYGMFDETTCDEEGHDTETDDEDDENDLTTNEGEADNIKIVAKRDAVAYVPKSKSSGNDDVEEENEDDVNVFTLIGGDVSDDSEEEEEEEEREEKEEEDVPSHSTSPTISKTSTVRQCAQKSPRLRRRRPRSYRAAGLRWTIPKGRSFRKQYACVYVTSSSAVMTTNEHLHAIRMRCVADNNTWWSYDVRKNALELIEGSEDVRRGMNRRFALVEKLRRANTIGIVVGTLAARGYLETLERVRDLCRKSDKRTYTFLVGKVNVPKLANFMIVDAYVLVGTSRATASIVEARARRGCVENEEWQSFPIPVASPYELDIALGDREWTGSFESGEWRSKTPVQTPVVETTGSTDKIDCPTTNNRVVVLNPSTALAHKKVDTLTKWISPAAELLARREFKGLDINSTEVGLDEEDAASGRSEFAMLRKGLDGVASEYCGERG